MENITLNIKEENDNKEPEKETFHIPKEKEVIRFYYFSELGLCGDDKNRHQHYCDKMISHGYTLIKITPLGNLDNNRDSYEGTLIYHWKLNKDE